VTALPVIDQASAPQPAQRNCALSACRPGSRATIVDVGCGPDEACRLRALGVCEGANVNVIDVRHCMLLEVRGTRLALGESLTAGITVQPVATGR